jgi:hypothetical protein
MTDITKATYKIQDILNQYNDGEIITDKDNAEVDKLEKYIKETIQQGE